MHSPDEQQTSPGADSSRRRVRHAVKLWAVGVDGMAALGTLMIVVLMAMIFADVLARNIIGGSLPLISELGALTVVMIVFLQLGTAIRNDRLARVDFFMDFVEARSPRAAAALTGVWHLIALAVCAAIAWSTWTILLKDLSARDFIGTPGVMTAPTWPFRVLILLGAIVATLQFLVETVGAFRRAGERQEPAP